MTRLVVLGITLLFLVFFAFLTVSVIARNGFTVASGLSLLVLALFAVGIVGALRHPPSR